MMRPQSGSAHDTSSGIWIYGCVFGVYTIIIRRIRARAKRRARRRRRQVILEPFRPARLTHRAATKPTVAQNTKCVHKSLSSPKRNDGDLRDIFLYKKNRNDAWRLPVRCACPIWIFKLASFFSGGIQGARRRDPCDQQRCNPDICIYRWYEETIDGHAVVCCLLCRRYMFNVLFIIVVIRFTCECVFVYGLPFVICENIAHTHKYTMGQKGHVVPVFSLEFEPESLSYKEWSFSFPKIYLKSTKQCLTN